MRPARRDSCHDVTIVTRTIEMFVRHPLRQHKNIHFQARSSCFQGQTWAAQIFALEKSVQTTMNITEYIIIVPGKSSYV